MRDFVRFVAGKLEMKWWFKWCCMGSLHAFQVAIKLVLTGSGQAGAHKPGSGQYGITLA